MTLGILQREQTGVRIWSPEPLRCLWRVWTGETRRWAGQALGTGITERQMSTNDREKALWHTLQLYSAAASRAKTGLYSGQQAYASLAGARVDVLQA